MPSSAYLEFVLMLEQVTMMLSSALTGSSNPVCETYLLKQVKQCCPVLFQGLKLQILLTGCHCESR